MIDDALDSVSVGAYLGRIGFTGKREPTSALLSELVAKHVEAIPFESLSPWLGEPVALDPTALVDKLVHRRRGGYCYEHNGLMLTVLKALGFQARALGARVLWNERNPARAARTHMLLEVQVPRGGPMWVDVGFGGVTPTAPLVCEIGVLQSTPHETYCVSEADDGLLELEVRLGTAWRTMYQFSLEALQPIDQELGNYWVSTHPSSRFVQQLIAARAHAGGRHTLMGRTLTEYRGTEGVIAETVLGDVVALRAALVDVFGIALPEGDALERALRGLFEEPG